MVKKGSAGGVVRGPLAPRWSKSLRATSYVRGKEHGRGERACKNVLRDRRPVPKD